MGLEERLTKLDQALTEVNKAAKALAGVASGLGKASAVGDLAGLARRFDQAPRMIEQLQATLAAAQGGFHYDAGAEFASGAYVKELRGAAEQAGIVMVEREGRLSAFPVLLKLETAAVAVRVGKKLERGIRPTTLVALLKQRQATQPFQAHSFLERLLSVYAALAPGFQTGWRLSQTMPGPIVPLLDIHGLLTVLPEAAAAYSRDTFAVDLLRLNRTPDTQTRSGHRFALSASTATKGRGFLRVYDETGKENLFAGISFSVA